MSSLDDIEHRILRPVWEDPRIHYAVNCAALGCPNLQTEAFTAENIEALLDKGAREYVNHPRGVTIEDGNLIVSSIYEWFQEDFGGSESGVIERLLSYAGPEHTKKLKGVSDIERPLRLVPERRDRGAALTFPVLCPGKDRPE